MGVPAETKLEHTVPVTVANVRNGTLLPNSLRGEEIMVGLLGPIKGRLLRLGRS